MAKTKPHDMDTESLPDEQDVAAFADALAERGRTILARVPDIAEGTLDALADAQDQVDGLSDMGVVAAAAFALGVSGGLMLAGAPRAILAVSMVPVFLTLRSAMTRGVRPARLVN